MGDLVPDKAAEGNGSSVGVEAGGLVPAKITLDKGGGTSFLAHKFDFLLDVRAKCWSRLQNRKDSIFDKDSKLDVEKPLDKGVEEQPKGSKKDDDAAIPSHL